MDEAPHLGLLEVRLFVRERDEAKRSLRRPLAKPARELEKDGRARRIVVRAGAAERRVVVGADDDDLVRAAPFSDQIRERPVEDGVALALDLVAREASLD